MQDRILYDRKRILSGLIHRDTFSKDRRYQTWHFQRNEFNPQSCFTLIVIQIRLLCRLSEGLLVRKNITAKTSVDEIFFNLIIAVCALAHVGKQG